MFEHSHEIAYDLVDPPPPAEVISLAEGCALAETCTLDETCTCGGTALSTSSHIWGGSNPEWGTRGEIDFDIISISSVAPISSVASCRASLTLEAEFDGSSSRMESFTSAESELSDQDECAAKSD